jgi:hypothetical protein
VWKDRPRWFPRSALRTHASRSRPTLRRRICASRSLRDLPTRRCSCTSASWPRCSSTPSRRPSFTGRRWWIAEAGAAAGRALRPREELPHPGPRRARVRLPGGRLRAARPLLGHPLAVPQGRPSVLPGGTAPLPDGVRRLAERREAPRLFGKALVDIGAVFPEALRLEPAPLRTVVVLGASGTGDGRELPPPRGTGGRRRAPGGGAGRHRRAWSWNPTRRWGDSGAGACASNTRRGRPRPWAPWWRTRPFSTVSAPGRARRTSPSDPRLPRSGAGRRRCC